MPKKLKDITEEELKNLPNRNSPEEGSQELEALLNTDADTDESHSQTESHNQSNSDESKLAKKCIIKARDVVWMLICAILIVCIWAIAAIELFPTLLVPSGFQAHTVEGINNIALGFSYSYIAGLILYFFTVAFPDYLKRQKFQPVIKEKIKGVGTQLHNMIVPFSSINNPVFLNESDNITAMMKSKDWNAPTIIPIYPGNPSYFKAFHSDCENLQGEISQIIADYKHLIDVDTILILEDIRSANVFGLVEIGLRVGGSISKYVMDAISEQFPKEVVEKYLLLAEKYQIEVR